MRPCPTPVMAPARRAFRMVAAAARSINDLEGEQSKWPTGAQLATAAAGEPAGVLGRLGSPILRCSGHARLVFGSMLAVSAMELISLQDIDGSAGCYRSSSAVLTEYRKPV
eukprot:SAG22_NODE_661_length_8059_cov_14.630402_4_plen_111_part_00